MQRLLLTAALLAFAGGARTATVTPLYAHDLPDVAGKEGAMLTVVLAPGEASPVHRHNADVFVYVLSGAVVMQVKGGAPETLQAGQTFYEAPSDIHVVSIADKPLVAHQALGRETNRRSRVSVTV